MAPGTLSLHHFQEISYLSISLLVTSVGIDPMPGPGVFVLSSQRHYWKSYWSLKLLFSFCLVRVDLLLPISKSRIIWPTGAVHIHESQSIGSPEFQVSGQIGNFSGRTTSPSSRASTRTAPRGWRQSEAETTWRRGGWRRSTRRAPEAWTSWPLASRRQGRPKSTGRSGFRFRWKEVWIPAN